MARCQIVIALEDNGSVSVQGPLHEKVVMFGLLEAAKDAVRSWKPQTVIPASSIPDVSNGNPAKMPGLRVVD